VLVDRGVDAGAVPLRLGVFAVLLVVPVGFLPPPPLFAMLAELPATFLPVAEETRSVDELPGLLFVCASARGGFLLAAEGRAT
jgi:hypothetical protein